MLAAATPHAIAITSVMPKLIEEDGRGLPCVAQESPGLALGTHRIRQKPGHRAAPRCGPRWSACYSVLRCATVRFMKIRTITQRELRNQSAAVLREVEAGRTIIVIRNGTPVGELR